MKMRLAVSAMAALVLAMGAGTTHAEATKYEHYKKPMSPAEQKARQTSSQLPRKLGNTSGTRTPDTRTPDNTSTGSVLTVAQKNEALAVHNKVRKEAAVAVPPYKWSNEAATHAQNWANKLSKDCNSLEHSKGMKHYENLAGGFSYSTPTSFMNGWISEKPHYDPKTKECINGQMCGHYRVMVSSVSTVVGCGMATCDCSKTNSCWNESDSVMWVCGYYPPNW